MNIYKEQELDNVFRDGLNTVRDFVCTTLGRNGYNVALAGKVEGEMLNTDVIRITKDGITALDHLRQNHSDQIVRQAANLIWSAVYKQWGAVGDGTTTTTFLTVGAYNLLLDYQIANPTLSAWQIAKDFRTLVDAILAEIEKLTRKIETKEQLRKLALISANGEEDIAELVSEAVWNAGVYGKITKERTSGAKSIIDARDGYVWDKGVCDTKSLLGYGKREEMNPFIFVLDDIFDKAEKFTTIQKAYQKLCEENKGFQPLVIICHSCEGEALHYIRAMADQKTPHKIIPIVAPKESVFRTQMLQDIATICNTKVYSPTSQWYDKKQNFLGTFGKAYRIETGYKETEIEYFKDFKPEQSYLDAIQSQADNDTFTDADREHFRERLARLTKGSCIIRVGSETSTSQDAKFDLFDDAIGASQSALRSGYVIGGGLTYLNAIWETTKPSDLADQLFLLFRRLSEKIGSINIGQIYHNDTKGLKVGTNEIIDYDKEGIYDPSQGVSNALNVAASIACSLITTQNGHL